jgi:hypothetical protein
VLAPSNAHDVPANGLTTQMRHAWGVLDTNPGNARTGRRQRSLQWINSA